MSCDCGCSCNCNTVIQKGDIGPQGPQGPQGTQGEQGEQGEPGENGNTVLNGATAPSAGTGSIGDFYINTETNEIYGPKSGSGWGSPTSLIGPQGPPGPGSGGDCCFEYEIGEWVESEGGVVFHRWKDGTTEYYKVVAAEDSSFSGVPEEWSNYDDSLMGADSLWNGFTNTDTVITGSPSPTSGAVKGAFDFVNTIGTPKTDWYLPAIQELNKIWCNMLEISETFDTMLPTSGLQMQGFTPPTSDFKYWSSTEFSNAQAWAFNFTSGTSLVDLKNSNFLVRAVRQFTYTP